MRSSRATLTGGRLVRAAAMLAIAVLAAPRCFAQGEELENARAAWRRANLDAYEYGYQKFCECHPESPPETLVTVRGGRVTAVRHRPQNYDGEVPAEERNLEFYWTVDELFELVASALRRGAELRADYDAALGHPTRIYIDYDADFIGDELDLKLTRVAALERE